MVPDPQIRYSPSLCSSAFLEFMQVPAMRLRVWLILLLLSGCVGCISTRDLLFEMFGSGYTGGGTSSTERKSDYEKQWQANDMRSE